MKMNLRKEYKSMKELKSELENQIFFFRRNGGLVYNTADEAIASFADRDEEVEEEEVYDEEITIEDQQEDEDGYTSTHTAEVKVTAYYTDPGSDDYVYVVTVEEDVE